MSLGNENNDLSSTYTQRSNLAPLSPYLNFDPSFLPSQPEYIFPEGASRQRGRFELAFSQIGAACILGAVVGGSTGFYNGLKSTTLAGQTGKVMRTRMLNHIMKQGAASSNTLGIIALMYSGIGVILSWARGADDDLNTIVAATTTGMLYKSTGSLRKCGVGGAIGLGLGSLYCLWTSRDKLTGFQQQYAAAILKSKQQIRMNNTNYRSGTIQDVKNKEAVKEVLGRKE